LASAGRGPPNAPALEKSCLDLRALKQRPPHSGARRRMAAATSSVKFQPVAARGLFGLGRTERWAVPETVVPWRPPIVAQARPVVVWAGFSKAGEQLPREDSSAMIEDCRSVRAGTWAGSRAAPAVSSAPVRWIAGHGANGFGSRLRNKWPACRSLVQDPPDPRSAPTIFRRPAGRSALSHFPWGSHQAVAAGAW